MQFSLQTAGGTILLGETCTNLATERLELLYYVNP